MLDLKLDKKAFVSFMEILVMNRFQTVSEINNYIWNKTGIKIFFEKHSDNDSEILEGYDERLISNLTINDEDLCYIDIYYLKDNSNQFYITEVALDFNT